MFLLLLVFHKARLRCQLFCVKTFNFKKIGKQYATCSSDTMKGMSLASFNLAYTPVMFEILRSSTCQHLPFTETNCACDGVSSATQKHRVFVLEQTVHNVNLSL